MPAPAYKRCPRCRETKPPESFNRNRTNADGMQSQCRDCQRRAKQEW